MQTDTGQTEDHQGPGAEPDGPTADADSAGCAPAARLVPLQRFGRHGRYAWAFPRRAD